MQPTIPTSSAEILYRLETYQPRKKLHLASAINDLEQKLITYQLLAIEQHFFSDQALIQPEESLYKRQTPEGHSDRELACISNLEALIPIDPWLIERATEEVLPSFPIFDQGIDLSDDILEQLRPGIQICLPLSHDGRYRLEHYEGQDWYETLFEFSLEAIQTPNPSRFNQLRQRFNQQPLPLRFIPLLVTIFDKNTGNIWLDSTNNEEAYGYGCDTIVPWKVDEIQNLIRQWKKAKDILTRIKTLADWLEGDLKPRFKQVLTIWNLPQP